MDISRNY